MWEIARGRAKARAELEDGVARRHKSVDEHPLARLDTASVRAKVRAWSVRRCRLEREKSDDIESRVGSDGPSERRAFLPRIASSATLRH